MIKVLNSDDALELSKKTLTSPSVSLVQVAYGAERCALSTVLPLKSSVSSIVQLDFIALALSGRKVDFGKMAKMIDEMVETLKTGQADDDWRKEYCGVQFDESKTVEKIVDVTRNCG